jgi:hypothetical protein
VTFDRSKGEVENLWYRVLLQARRIDPFLSNASASFTRAWRTNIKDAISGSPTYMAAW